MKFLSSTFLVCLLISLLISCNKTSGNYNVSNAELVTIGDKTWIAENLAVSEFRNGDKIPEVTSDEEWKRAGEEGKPAWCYYNNDPANAEKYGILYNWYAVSDKRGLAPEGWHIPTDEEWTALSTQLGEKAGSSMKSKSWMGTGESGFNALPGGNRNHDGSFHLAGNYGVWWTATPAQSNFAWFRFLTSVNGFVSRDYSNKAKGLSVRLIKD